MGETRYGTGTMEPHSTAGDKPRVRVMRSSDERPTLPIVEGEGTAYAIVWPGVGAEERSFHQILLGSGARTVQQRHAGEAVYHVSAGTADIVDLDTGAVSPLRVGSMVHVEPSTGYRFIAGPEGAEVIGGPCPADPVLYTTIGLMPADDGGD